MASTIPVGSDVSSGRYRCTNCSYELGVESVTSLPPCPECDGPYAWEALTGGDATDDPIQTTPDKEPNLPWCPHLGARDGFDARAAWSA